MWKEFGDERLRDTGISKLQGAAGVAIGAAMAGSRAIVNEVFLDFALEAMTQIVQQAANISYSFQWQDQGAGPGAGGHGIGAERGGSPLALLLLVVRQHAGFEGGNARHSL